jgi:hypothetical protein
MSETSTLPLWVDIAVKLTPAFFTVVLGSVGAYIGYLQYRLNNDRMRLDLSAKRQEAYELLQKHLSQVFRDGEVKMEALLSLQEARIKSRFLFGADVKDKFNELWSNAVDARALHYQLYDGQGGGLPNGDQRSRVSHEHGEKIKWYLGQMSVVDELYAKYLEFDHGRHRIL